MCSGDRLWRTKAYRGNDVEDVGITFSKKENRVKRLRELAEEEKTGRKYKVSGSWNRQPENIESK